MKTIKKAGIISMLAFFAFCLVAPDKAVAQFGPSISYQTFYDELAPYGQWVSHPQYGYVWIANAGPDFHPYASNGHWIVTEYGNTWVSEYPWGWAPFHYGRWFFDNYYGWAWVPDTEWGPAWVAWRSGGGYYGWAPLGPGVNINVTVAIPSHYWYFIPQAYIASPYPYRYCVPRPQVVNVYHNTVYVTNTYRHENHVYVCGPRGDEIERVTRQPVTVHRIDNMSRPSRSQVQNGSVGMYRPGVVDNAQRDARPARATDYSYGDNTNRNYTSGRSLQLHGRSAPATRSYYERNNYDRQSPERGYSERSYSNAVEPAQQRPARVENSTNNRRSTENNYSYLDVTPAHRGATQEREHTSGYERTQRSGSEPMQQQPQVVPQRPERQSASPRSSEGERQESPRLRSGRYPGRE